MEVAPGPGLILMYKPIVQGTSQASDTRPFQFRQNSISISFYSEKSAKLLSEP